MLKSLTLLAILILPLAADNDKGKGKGDDHEIYCASHECHEHDFDDHHGGYNVPEPGTFTMMIGATITGGFVVLFRRKKL